MGKEDFSFLEIDVELSQFAISRCFLRKTDLSVYFHDLLMNQFAQRILGKAQSQWIG